MYVFVPSCYHYLVNKDVHISFQQPTECVQCETTARRQSAPHCALVERK